MIDVTVNSWAVKNSSTKPLCKSEGPGGGNRNRKVRKRKFRRDARESLACRVFVTVAALRSHSYSFQAFKLVLCEVKMNYLGIDHHDPLHMT